MDTRWIIVATIGMAAGLALGQQADGHHAQAPHAAAAAANQPAQPPIKPESWPWKKYFATGKALAPVTGLKPGDEAFEVRDSAKRVLGWVFRTDHVSPVIRGRNAEIGVMVALGKDGKIVGVEVIENHETPAYFHRLTSAFYHQFVGHAVSAPATDIDAVTGATISSDAVIRDVFESSAELLKVVQPATPKA